MKEYSLTIAKPYVNGLKPYSRFVRNNNFLYEAQNAVPRKEGMHLYKRITQLLDPTPTVDFPFPQMFKGRDFIMLCFETTIYIVNADWTYTQIVTYDAYSVGTPKAITAGGAWHFVDYGEQSWYLFNGSCVVFESKLEEFTGTDSNKAFVIDDVDIECGCTHRGRHVMGGFNPTTFWKDDWDDFWSDWIDNYEDITDNLPDNLRDNVKNNFLWWGQVGGGDALSLFFSDVMRLGVTGDESSYDEDEKPMLFDMLEKNDGGFLPVHWQGAVYQTLPMGKNVIVYGSEGISALTLERDPISTYGYKEIANFGTFSRLSAGGGDGGHVFVSTAGDIWKITPELELIRLGFNEYISAIVNTDLVVQYNPYLNDFYISDGVDSFILTDDGLGQIRECATSLFMFEGSLIGVAEDVAGANRGDFIVTTDVLDFGYRAKKMVQLIEVAVDTADIAYVAIDYRHDKSDDYTRSKFVRTNPEGVAVLPVSGLDVRIVVKVPFVNEVDWYVDQDYILIRWKPIDMRYIRGLNVAKQDLS